MNKAKKENNTSKIKAFILGQAAKPEVLTYPLGEKGNLVVNVTPVLPFTQRAQMVRTIADIVFVNDEEHISDYSPEYLKFAQKFSVISYYTDLKLPTDVNDAWLVLDNTTLYDDVVKIVGDDVQCVFAEANELISAKKNYLINKTDINKLFGKISEKLESFSSQFTEQDLKSIMQMLEKLPKDTSPENLVKAVAAVEKENEIKN